MAFKIFRKNCCGLDVHKTWIYACIGITDTNGRTEYKQARFSSFTKGLQELADCLAKYDCNDVCMESSGKFWIPVFNILEKTCWVTLAHPKYTKPQKGNKTDRKDAKWICDLYMCDMVKPSFIPPPDIRQLRDLMRYRMKLTNMAVSEKNRALNCLTVSNLKLDDVFSDVFGKSSRSIIHRILEHPGEAFDVAPFIDRRCKHSVEEVQAAVDGAISHEQAVKLRECLQHLDELETHKTKPAKVMPPAAFGRRYDFSIRVYEVRSSCAEVCVLHNVVTAQILCCIAQHDLAGFEYIAAIRYLERLIGVLLDDKYSNTALV